MITPREIIRDFVTLLDLLYQNPGATFTDMMNKARALASERMAAQAMDMGADAIVGVRYASSAIMQGAAEVIVYGTAVKFVNK